MYKYRKGGPRIDPYLLYSNEIYPIHGNLDQSQKQISSIKMSAIVLYINIPIPNNFKFDIVAPIINPMNHQSMHNNNNQKKKK